MLPGFGSVMINEVKKLSINFNLDIKLGVQIDLKLTPRISSSIITLLIFLPQITQTLSIKDKKEKREAKKKLLDEVRAWIDEDEERARDALKESAKEIIDYLKLIEEQISKKFMTSKCI